MTWLHRMTRVATRYLKHFSFLYRLHKDIKAFHITQGASVTLPKPRRAVMPAAWWGKEEDRDCLLGTVRHGWGNWKGICEDETLCFKQKGVVYPYQGTEDEEPIEENEGEADSSPVLVKVEAELTPVSVKSETELTPVSVKSEAESPVLMKPEDISASAVKTDISSANIKLFPGTQLLMKRIRRLVDAMEAALAKGLQSTSLDYVTTLTTSPKKAKKASTPFMGTWLIKESKAMRNAVLRWGLPIPPISEMDRLKLLNSDHPIPSEKALQEEKLMAEVCDLMDEMIRDVQNTMAKPVTQVPLDLLADPQSHSARDTASPFPYHKCPVCRYRFNHLSYCLFCDLYVPYRMLKVQSGLLYKSYTEVITLARFIEEKTRQICDMPGKSRAGKNKGMEEELPNSVSEAVKIPADVEALIPSTVLAQRLHSRLQLFYELQLLVWSRDDAVLQVLLRRWSSSNSHHQDNMSKGWSPPIHDLALLHGLYHWGVVEWDVLWRDPDLPFFISEQEEAKRRNSSRANGRKRGGKRGGKITGDPEPGEEEPAESGTSTRSIEHVRVSYTREEAIQKKSPKVNRSDLVGVVEYLKCR